MPHEGAWRVNGWELNAVAQARVGRLASVRPNGRPHVVVVAFGLVDDDTIVTVVDAKPKQTLNLQRLRNLSAHPEFSLLVDHYEEDWERLWWVRLDGTADIVTSEPRRRKLLLPLTEKYPQYRDAPPPGPAIVLSIGSWASWSAAGSRPR